MSIEEQKRLARQSLGMWASGNQVAPEAVFATDYVNHQEPDAEGGVTAKSLAEWKALVAGYHQAFSESQVEITHQLAEGDLVATRWRFTATHSGDYMGLAATGRRVSWTGLELDRVAEGKIAESWVDWDKYGLFQALGLVD